VDALDFTPLFEHIHIMENANEGTKRDGILITECTRLYPISPQRSDFTNILH